MRLLTETNPIALTQQTKAKVLKYSERLRVCGRKLAKTNFFLSIAERGRGAACTPLHRGRSTMVWQTRVLTGDGRTVSIVTQTQRSCLRS